MESDAKRQTTQTLIRKLLQKYPLHQFRNNGSLSILLEAEHAADEDVCQVLTSLIREILPNGQLLDTTLSVTVCCQDACAFGAKLLEKATDLHRFVKLEGTPVSGNPELTLASVSFTDSIDTEKWDYRIICGREPEQTSLPQDHSDERLCAFLSEDHVTVISPVLELLDAQEDMELQELHEKIAYNVHYAYSKNVDPRATRREIEDEFNKAGYSYASSLSHVIHLRSKLACCGITEPDLTKAAAQFARLMKANPEIIGKLAVLEHRRWLLEKLLKGLRLPENLDDIYSNDENNTHSKDWHSALLPCSGDHRLRLADWKTDATNCREELDRLDRMSLAVHQKCRQLAVDRLRDIRIILTSIRNTLVQHSDLPNQETVLAHFYNMESSISQMYQKKRIAIRRYHWSKSEFLDALPANQPLWVKTIIASCEAIDVNLKPLFEYVVDKDYKELNYLMIRQIPFSITHEKDIRLAKLFDLGTEDCQFAPWQMEPTHIIYIGFADSWENLVKLSERAGHIAQFLKRSCNETHTRFHVLLPDDSAVQSAVPAPLVLHRVGSRDSAVIQETISEILKPEAVRYFDLTCGNPVLSGPAERYAQEEKIGAFYVNGTQMYSIHCAEELEYPAPTKGISVLEMFIQTGAARLESEGICISDLSNVYQGFWDASRTTEEWDGFCKFISSVCSDQKSKKSYRLSSSGKKGMPVPQELRMHSGILHKLLPVLRELEAYSYIENVKLTWIVGDLMKLEFRAKEKEASCLLHHLTGIAGDDKPDYYYNLKWTTSEKAIQVKTLKLKNIELPKDFSDEYAHLLKALEKADVIYSLNKDVQETGKASFSIGAVEFLDALRNSGKVLEYYIYNTALQDCQFEDVDMSWKFYHSEDADSAHNEVDVICTKGTTSLFISAKNVKLDTFKRSSNYLNYVCYEVSVLANRFGIHAKTVLAAPNVPQFVNGKRSDKVQHAMSRGVYLLGDLCFESGRLGEILDNIARGEEHWCECLLERT